MTPAAILADCPDNKIQTRGGCIPNSFFDTASAVLIVLVLLAVAGCYLYLHVQRRRARKRRAEAERAADWLAHRPADEDERWREFAPPSGED